MSTFKLFMKDNKISRSNSKFAPTSSLLDESGKPLEWEFKPLSTRENDFIRESCFNYNSSSPQFNHTLYLAKMISACVVFPNLLDAGLQNSYGVFSPEDLLLELVDNPSEYHALSDFVSSFNGYQLSFSDKVSAAKK